MVVTPPLMTVSSTPLDLAFVTRNRIRKPDPNAYNLTRVASQEPDNLIHLCPGLEGS